MALPPPVAAVRVAVRRALADLQPGAVAVVACSGGSDSLALLSAAVFEGHRAGLVVVGATVDHGLQDGSADRAARVVEQMAALGVDETVSARVHVEGAGTGPEAAARQARYAVLDQVAERFGAGVVLLGHTRDDQAETVLMGLARGSGGRSIAGMRRAFDRYRRPLLDVTRAQARAACEAEGIGWWSDPHNSDPGFTRVRVRDRVLPVLEAELGPGVAEALARTADLVRPDMEYLDQVADAELARLAGPAGSVGAVGAVEALPVEALLELPSPIRTRVLRLAALAAGAPAAEVYAGHVAAMDRLLTDWHGQRWVDLPGHLRCRRRDGVLLWEPARDGT